MGTTKKTSQSVPDTLSKSEGAEQAALTITPALIREITDKVYALWLRDLRLERERLGVHRANTYAGSRSR